MADDRNLSLTGEKKSRSQTYSRGGKKRLFAQVTATHFTDDSLNPRQIRYRFTAKPYSQTSGLAIPYHRSYTEVPLIGELIEIIPGPGIHPSGRGPIVDYYLASVDIYNHPEHGATSIGNTTPILAPEFIEDPTINPLMPYPGDILIQGRRSQSIRFSENFTGTPWTSPTGSQPIIVISNGQVKTSQGENYINENAFQDAASIYLAQNQKIDLEVDKKWKRGDLQTSYTQKHIPPAAKDYTGDQILLTSGRIYLNAKTENVLLSANQSVGLLGAQVHLDATETINFDAPTLKLTGEALDPTKVRSAVKGEDLTEELATLYRHLENLANSVIPLASAANDFNLVKTAKELAAFANSNNRSNLKSNLLSKRVYLS